ncbi:hypothetical protein ACJX0J_029695, partial [Zea mays]
MYTNKIGGNEILSTNIYQMDSFFQSSSSHSVYLLCAAMIGLINRVFNYVERATLK